MNTMRLLIIATFTCLTAAVVYFYINNSQTESLADLELRVHQARLDQKAQSIVVPLTPTPPIYKPAVNPYPVVKTPSAEEIKRQADAAEQALINAEKLRLGEEDAARKAEMAKKNGGDDKNRQWVIKNALLQATVNEFDIESGILIINLMPEHNLVPGQIIGIRRNSGIFGRVTVSRIENYKIATADPIPGSFFGGDIDIKVGDELITLP